jgi:hypothetical protein
MAYTWQDTLLGIDMYNEAQEEKEAKQKISDKQQEEANWLSAGSFLATTLCGAIWGPAGSFICNQIATIGIDAAVDWESETLPSGKFYPDLEDDYNKSIRDAAKTQTATQVTTAVTDLLQAYISSGGLTAEPGEWDPTTYGSGDAEWSWLGRGTPEETEIIQVSDLTDEGERYMREGVRTITEQSEDYVPSAFGDDFIRKKQDFGDMVISGAGTILDLVRRN